MPYTNDRVEYETFHSPVVVVKLKNYADNSSSSFFLSISVFLVAFFFLFCWPTWWNRTGGSIWFATVAGDGCFHRQHQTTIDNILSKRTPRCLISGKPSGTFAHFTWHKTHTHTQDYYHLLRGCLKGKNTAGCRFFEREKVYKLFLILLHRRHSLERGLRDISPLSKTHTHKW